MKILFTGGGSGGHVFPIIAIVRQLKKLQLIRGKPKFEFFYIGPEDGFASFLLTQEGVKVKTIFSGKIRRYLTLKSFYENFIDIAFKIPLGFFQSFFHIFFLAPDLVFSKGGYGSLAPVITGWMLQVPIFLHESDIVPGITNRFLGRFALEIFVSFPRTEYFNLKKMILVGNPIRKSLLVGTKKEAKALFNLTNEKPIILVLGGSQGAEPINNALFDDLRTILKKFEIIHQCGAKNFEQIKAESKIIIPKELEKYYHLTPFLKEHELKQAYACCDWIISRAGSGSIFEIAAIGKPSVLVPLPESAQNHQARNAYFYAARGAGLVIEEPNFDISFFSQRLEDLSNSPRKIQKIREKAKEFSKVDAGEVVAGYIMDYLC